MAIDGKLPFGHHHPMKLSKWLANAEMSCAEFGRRIGATREMARRYASGETLPPGPVRRRIVRETDGLVGYEDLAEEHERWRAHSHDGSNRTT